jgi:cell division septation protein DedD
MTDVRADDDDRLPWLEAVDEDETRDGPSAAKLIAFVVIGLVAIGLIVGGLFWMGNRGNEGGEAVAGAGAGADDTLIAAPQGDYKMKPSDPGGMKVEGQGGTALAASEGAEPKGQINVNAVTEAPVTAQPRAAQPAPAQTPTQVAVARPTPTPAPAATPAAQPAVAAAGGGATIQLGAFDSAATANSAWKAMSGRFKYLAPLSQSVMTANVKGKTYYRLRASGAGARDICRRLEVAGETCIVVN